MQFQSQQRRFFWYSLTIGAIVDLAISALLAISFEDDFSWMMVGFIFLAIQVLSLLLALRTGIVFVVGQKLGGNKLQEEAFVAALNEGDFPKPKAFERSGDSFLSSLIDDEKLDAAVRSKAALLLGMVQGITSGRFMVSIATNVALERAIARYNRE